MSEFISKFPYAHTPLSTKIASIMQGCNIYFKCEPAQDSSSLAETNEAFINHNLSNFFNYVVLSSYDTYLLDGVGYCKLVKRLVKASSDVIYYLSMFLQLEQYCFVI